MAEKKAVAKPPTLPKRPDPKDRWPQGTPQFGLWSQDNGRLLRLILNRLDAIEERLARIEEILKNL